MESERVRNWERAENLSSESANHDIMLCTVSTAEEILYSEKKNLVRAEKEIKKRVEWNFKSKSRKKQSLLWCAVSIMSAFRVYNSFCRYKREREREKKLLKRHPRSCERYDTVRDRWVDLLLHSMQCIQKSSWMWRIWTIIFVIWIYKVLFHCGY